MKLSCCCGVIVGFVLALLLSGAVYLYFYRKNNPQETNEHFEQVEEKWSEIKQGGDRMIEKAKPVIMVQEAVAPAIKNQIEYSK